MYGQVTMISSLPLYALNLWFEPMIGDIRKREISPKMRGTVA
jgi:hypothetical protein